MSSLRPGNERRLCLSWSVGTPPSHTGSIRGFRVKAVVVIGRSGAVRPGKGAVSLAIAAARGAGWLSLGLDISGPMLEAARQRAHTARLSNAIFEHGDARPTSWHGEAAADQGHPARPRRAGYGGGRRPREGLDVSVEVGLVGITAFGGHLSCAEAGGQMVSGSSVSASDRSSRRVDHSEVCLLPHENRRSVALRAATFGGSVMGAALR
jgi:hypothetical protein